jgi:hypothetical protein
MIPVALQPPPDVEVFETQVSRPGAAFLRSKPRPKGREWKGHEYWRRAIPWMHQVYGDVCQYSCHWIPRDTGFSSIEHFVSRESAPSEAYTWSNFRLVSGRLNGRRGTRRITDPSQMPEGLYEIVFPALLVRVGEGFDAELSMLADETIRVLGLNDESTCLANRVQWYRAYINGDISAGFLRGAAPFLAREMERQGLL